jgi:hypothetical protein
MPVPIERAMGGKAGKECGKIHWRGGNCGFGTSPLLMPNAPSRVLVGRGKAEAKGVDPDSGAIYCSECDDTVYPDQMEQMMLSARLQAEEMADTSGETTAIGGKKRASYRAGARMDAEIDFSKAKKASCRGEHLFAPKDHYRSVAAAPLTHFRHSTPPQPLPDLLSLRHPPILPAQPLVQVLLS